MQGYRVELPEEHITAEFTRDSELVLTPALVGPTITRNSGIIGETVDLTVRHLADVRQSTVLFNLTRHLLYHKFRDAGNDPEMHLFGKLKRVTKQWLDQCLVCKGDTYPSQLMIQELADMACERITAGINRSLHGTKPINVIVDAYNPEGSTNFVNFTTSNEDRWQTDPRKCHVNWAMLDSEWEGEFCRVVESHPLVLKYVKNHGLGFEVPYLMAAESKRYRPDFIIYINDGHGPDDPLKLIVEIKGFRGEDAKVKKETMEVYWVPGVNNSGRFGRWAFAEFCDVYEIEADFRKKIEAEFQKLVDTKSAGFRIHS